MPRFQQKISTFNKRLLYLLDQRKKYNLLYCVSPEVSRLGRMDRKKCKLQCLLKSWGRYLPWIRYDNFAAWYPFVRSSRLNLVDNVHSWQDFTKHDMFPIQPSMLKTKQKLYEELLELGYLCPIWKLFTCPAWLFWQNISWFHFKIKFWRVVLLYGNQASQILPLDTRKREFGVATQT